MKGYKLAQPNETLLFTPEHAWPESDRALYRNCLREGGFLLDGGWGSHWSEATRVKYVYNYGRWISWLKRTDPSCLALTPGDRVTQRRVEEYRQHMLKTQREYSVASHLSGLGSMIWAMTETDSFGWVQCAAKRIERRAPRKNKRSVLQDSDRLKGFGFELMKDADAGVGCGVRYPPAVLFRNGLIIAVLANWPIRVKNLSSIELGKHLTGTKGNYRIDFSAEETKQKQEIGFLLPADLQMAMERYLEVYRPILLAMAPYYGRQPTFLWVGADGDKLGKPGIQRLTNLYTKKKFGRGLYPHKFRDSAATTIATKSPANIEDVKAVLGHSKLSTSGRHYNQASSMDAGRSYHAALRKVRAIRSQ